MRSLDISIKADFIQKGLSGNSTPRSSNAGTWGRKKDSKDERQPRDASRSRSRGFSFKGGLSTRERHGSDSSNTKRPRSADLSQPVGSYKTLMLSSSSTSLAAMNTCVDTASDPADFLHYLKEIQKPEMVDVGKLHKLRILLRNESVSWVNAFIADGGMDEIVQLIYRIMQIEWRYALWSWSTQHPLLEFWLTGLSFQRGT